MSIQRESRVVIGPIVAALIVTMSVGCASVSPGASAPDTGGDASVSSASASSASSDGAQQPLYSCDELRVPAEVLTDGRTAETLGKDGQAALAGMDVPEIEPAEWLVLEERPEHVALLRELPEPYEHDPGDLRTHEYLEIELVEDPNVPAPGWMLFGANTCALRTVKVGAANVTLDPDHPLDPASRQVHLLVTESACAGGEAAEGRVRLATLTEGGDTVDVVIDVEPLDGMATCQSNPPTPFVVELDEPLGERTVRDVAVHPARELTLLASTEPMPTVNH